MDQKIGTWQSFQINTAPPEGFPAPVRYEDVTQQIRDAVPEGCPDGVMHVFVPHTTCTLIFNSGFDGTTLADIRMYIERAVPVNGPFVHLHDGPQDASGHVRCIFGVQSLTMPIADGKLDIGLAQGIYLLEFDGPRDRTIRYAINPFNSGSAE